MPTDEQLRSLPLRPGRNTITFRVNGPVAELTAYVYYMHWSTRLVISDVDGEYLSSL
jgi:phosphatidate phosphatase PAH1